MMRSKILHYSQVQRLDLGSSPLRFHAQLDSDNSKLKHELKEYTFGKNAVCVVPKTQQGPAYLASLEYPQNF